MDREPTKSALTGQSALVTGGSRGLGLLLAERLAARGNRVTIAARDPEELERAASWVARHTGTTPTTRVCDVREEEAVGALVAQTAEEQGGLDAVFSVAGIIQVAPVAALDPESFRAAMDTMFHGNVHTSLAALPHLRRSPYGGRLILVGSVGGLLAVPHLVPYSCAKAAVAALAEGLRTELAGSAVSVTAAHPGLIRTGSHRQAQFGGDRAREFAWFAALSGAPLVSMDARRAAERIVRAAERRRVRLVLTPAARAAGLAHGVAPALTTRASGLAARLLPAPGPGDDLAAGHRLAEPRLGRWQDTLRRLGSRLNDRAAHRFNQ
ncbi:SDR family NAD(P)-dependent oxidoreductase [Streptomyces physcomitrii]|uniref:SDR family oxidoreductase n=1 Tax=Streptomyces physcomitrii TaxID=2724184 RepID=A0ABX1H0Q4_9ACTN|nr:SDR family oxidoreductase [Streptomyces physcomitrii]NKI41942.1 SDR family oxidoreductase [Streptomyces physcomitrii]